MGEREMERGEASSIENCPYSPQTCLENQVRISEMCLKCQLEQAKFWVKPY